MLYPVNIKTGAIGSGICVTADTLDQAKKVAYSRSTLCQRFEQWRIL